MCFKQREASFFLFVCFSLNCAALVAEEKPVVSQFVLIVLRLRSAEAATSSGSFEARKTSNHSAHELFGSLGYCLARFLGIAAITAAALGEK